MALDSAQPRIVDSRHPSFLSTMSDWEKDAETIECLRTINAELLVALKACQQACSDGDCGSRDLADLMRAVIKHAELRG